MEFVDPWRCFHFGTVTFIKIFERKWALVHFLFVRSYATKMFLS